MANKHLQFLRNLSFADNYEAAVKTLTTYVGEQSLPDGTPIVVRFGSEGFEKAILGVTYVREGGEKGVSYTELSNLSLSELNVKLTELSEQIGKIDVTNQIEEVLKGLTFSEIGGDNQYVTTISQENGQVSAVAHALVASGDKVLTLTDNGIETTVEVKSLTSDEIAALEDGANVKEAYKLVGKDNQVLGETIKIYKDQSLKEVKLEGDNLNFTYILANGAESTVGIDVSTFLKEAEFKDGFVLGTNKTVSVKLAPETAENKNFLDYETTSEGGNASLAVRSIDTNKALLQQPIKVAGLNGTLGTGNYKNGDTIAAGTSIYDILVNILSQELFPTTTSTNGTISASIANKAISGKIGDTSITANNTTVEFGSQFIMNSITTNASTVSTTNSKVTGFDNGYSAENDSVADSTDTSITKTWTTSVDNNTYTLSASLTGFNASNDGVATTATTPTTNSGTGSATLAQTTLGYVAEGDNKITVNVTGASYKGSVDEIPSYYIVSNLGKTKADKVSTKVDAKTDAKSNTPTNSTSLTVKGAYKYFMGYSTNTTYNQFDSDSVRALTVKTGWVTKDGTTTVVAANAKIKSDGTSVVIACPSKYKLASVDSPVGPTSVLSAFSSVGTVKVNTGSVVTPYTVYVWPITSGTEVEFQNMTLAKA